MVSNIKWIALFSVLILGVVACGKESGLQRPPDLSIYFTEPPNVQGENYDPSKVYSIPPPGVNNEALYDVEIFNQGDGSMNILNVYLAEGSNPYVTMEWAESDPSAQGLFRSGQPVIPCGLATGGLSNPALLPPAQGMNLTQCSFPMELAGKDPVTNLIESRKVRLRYRFDIAKDAPNNDPVNLVVQVDWREGSLGQEGVVNIPLQVQGCIPQISFYPPRAEFATTDEGQTDTVEVCLSNNGCQPLTVQNVALQTAAVGDVFEFQEKRQCARTGQSCITDQNCGECSVSKDYCSSDIECGTGGPCEYAGDNACENKYGPLIGGIIQPKQQDPEAQICFDVKYKPFESGQEVSGEDNLLVIQTDDPIQPTVNIPLSTGGTECELAYELTHTDQVESELTYMDFTNVVPGEVAMKTISVQNVGGELGCPLKLDSLKFQTATDSQKSGGYFWVVVRREGEEIGSFGKVGASDFTPFSVNPGQGFDLDVYFEAPPAEVQISPSEITLNLRSEADQFSRVVSIQAGGGTSKLALGPSGGTGGTQAKFWFSSDGETVSKTLALYNEGLEPVKIDAFTLDAGNGNTPDDFTLMSDDDCVVDGTFICEEIPGFGMLSVVIEYTPVSGLASPNAFAYVWTEEDPFTGESGASANYVVNLYGNYQYPKTMPYAEPVVIGAETEVDEDGDDVYVGFSSGQTVSLDGSGSTTVEDGMTLVEQGYIWWITMKPEGSAAKLNQVSGPKASFVVDSPGLYSAHLVVTGQDGDDFVFSEENWVYINVE